MKKESLGIAREYLTFLLGDEEYGVDILRVQEIRVWSPVTVIPNTPDYLKGVINLRGTIVPIVDLRQRFRYQTHDFKNTTVVIVLQGEVNGKTASVGLVVDAVSDVHKVDATDIKEAPDLGRNIDGCFVQGMATLGDQIIILLDSVALLNVDELLSQSGQPIMRAG
ncbi:purine-binding chemotaxis protein CheW [Ketobacter sp. MCCC 1A13808]|uniref:chemotaxis protein CheW n=1 Tax=Ketobacter sp. MCCC 1A13808 TaxID=2602738 RepID=UPI000F182E1C|nr:chemotaxis protein CheW [Ketobacter sp. MCCC 1A13808]MVF13208.1 purine-binding chemotaxis protein CheW [Ketobacter sp. MCCC 1A13808]RLP54205.1 MAG: purine-binding chemotaxis protein CheW [Ketobacter sp.]